MTRRFFNRIEFYFSMNILTGFLHIIYIILLLLFILVIKESLISNNKCLKLLKIIWNVLKFSKNL